MGIRWKDNVLILGGLTDVVISCFYESRGVKLAVRSQPRSWYLRHVCLWGRAELGSAIVNDCYLAS